MTMRREVRITITAQVKHVVCMGDSVFSVAAFGPRSRGFDAHSLLRFQLLGEA